MGHKRSLETVNGVDQQQQQVLDQQTEEQQHEEQSFTKISKKKKLKPNGQTPEKISNNNDNEEIGEIENPAEDDQTQIIVPRTRRDLVQLPYDQKLQFVSVIAQPMASKKLAKKLAKLMRKASGVSRKEMLRIGLKEVQLRIRKGERGLVVFAGDVTPIEIMCHLPAICEEKDLPYIFIPFRTDISSAIGVRRPALMVMIKKHDDYADLYDECQTKIKEIMVEFLKQHQ